MTIKEIRQHTGLSQIKFAEKYSIPRRTLEAWECGRRDPAEYFLILLWRAVKEDFKIKGETKMKKWYLIDEVGGDIWDTPMDAATKEEAAVELETEWDKLTRHDQIRRTRFYAALGNVTEDGIDFENITETVELR